VGEKENPKTTEVENKKGVPSEGEVKMRQTRPLAGNVPIWKIPTQVHRPTKREEKGREITKTPEWSNSACTDAGGILDHEKKEPTL